MIVTALNKKWISATRSTTHLLAAIATIAVLRAVSSTLTPGSSKKDSVMNNPHEQLLLQKITDAVPCRVPLIRRSLITDPQAISAATPTSTTISVFQWNILADCFSEESQFTRCPAGATTWETRRWRVLEEIVRFEPDLICLQVRRRGGKREGKREGVAGR